MQRVAKLFFFFQQKIESEVYELEFDRESEKKIRV